MFTCIVVTVFGRLWSGIHAIVEGVFATEDRYYFIISEDRYYFLFSFGVFLWLINTNIISKLHKTEIQTVEKWNAKKKW